MNYWAKNIIPYSWNPKGISVNWSGSDTETNFSKNPENYYWKNIDITYAYNKHGFRTYEFESLLGKKVDVALGCSHTEGVGLPANFTWPYLLEQHRPNPMLNLGLGGGASDTIARILTNITGVFDIQTVFIQWPNYLRFETYTNNLPDFVIPQEAKIEHAWYIDDFISKQRLYKNRLLVNSLGHRIVNLPVTGNNEIHEPKDYARDHMHFGLKTQQTIVNMFLKELTNIR